MFGWRKKRDGFEWRSYVRTTILVKRKQRRDKLDDAKQAALDSLAQAGRVGKVAGQSGVEAARRGIDAARREAQAASAKIAEKAAAGAEQAGHEIGARARAASEAARIGAVRAGSGLWRISRVAGGRLGKASGQGLGQLTDGIAGTLAGAGRAMSPRVSLPLVIAGTAAAIGGVARTAQHGVDAIAVTAAVLAAVLLGLAVLPVIAGRATLRAPFATRRHAPGEDAASPGSHEGGASGARAGAMALVIMLMMALVGGLGWLAMPYLSRAEVNVSAPKINPTSETIEGQAKALSGDVMAIAGEKVVLRGIEAPEMRQSCADARGRKWRCGRSALNALRRITGYEKVVCAVSGTDREGRKIADCRIGETDIAAELVKRGHVFAAAGFFSTHGALEDAAKAEKLGIWQGEAKRPSENRSGL